jgi:beta-lactamase regulating signal transducer with metallopeptidase domain
LIFCAMAAALVHLAGRKDVARAPLLTGVSLVLIALFPLLAGMMPKLHVLPVDSVRYEGSGFSGAKVIFGIWVVGFALMMLRLFAGIIALERWRSMSQTSGCTGDIEIRMLHGIKGPVAAGIFRKVVFVPESWTLWSAENQRIALHHETAHHRRRDPLWRFLAGIACAVHWFNPLVWWMARRLAIQCELACDAAVIDRGAKPSEYAKLLCDFAEETHHQGCAVAMAAKSTLEVRVRRMMQAHDRRGMAGVSMLVAIMVALAALLASLGSRPFVNETVSPEEVRLRWSADPFPGGNGAE